MCWPSLTPGKHYFQTHSATDDDVNMEDGASFLLADDDSGSRILVFASTKGRGILKTGQNFFRDGTFKSYRMQFYQLHPIHADLSKNEEEDTTIVPIIFTLLPRKNSEIYSKLFVVLKTSRVESKFHYHGF
ncbi:hypothetical protein AVEN_187857-1 [Araneus ventricosus]|uniref:Uncharacterized protein n=1 Tax=Araneus ventricosus TaxID=182803 RepID=A0A4Y2CS70_ARAVE|nr:hypothetical protein AVEN_187857-1 [Araneus ventricosus]